MANNNHYYNIGINLVEDFMNKCLDVIKKQIEQIPGGHLHFNHEEYIYMSENEDGEVVPFLHQHRGLDVELYSYDGWIKPEDIGHWADVAIQIVEDIKAGDAARWGYEKGFKIKEKEELKA